MSQAASDLDRLLGGASPIRVVAPVADSGAVHCDGAVDIARLIPRAIAAQRQEKPRRSILTR